MATRDKDSELIEKDLPGNSPGRSSLSAYVQDLFEAFKTSRKPFEDVWIECWTNYLGQYQQNTAWKKETEGTANRSKIFIKLTTLKCNTAHSKIVDASFSGKGEVPFDAIPIDIEEMGMDPEMAKKMAAKIRARLQDHFREIELDEVMDTAVLECAILGTAVLKGPIVEVRRKLTARPRMIGGMPVSQMDSEINPYEMVEEESVLPVVDHVPLWEYFTDANAKKPSEAIGEIHFQRLLPAEFRKLAYQGGYDAQAVLEAAESVTVRDKDDFRFVQLGDDLYMGEAGAKDEKISTLEFWGLVPVRMLREGGCKDIPESYTDMDTIEAMVVLAGKGTVIKACINPIGRRPFYVCPYKKRPHIIYGQGVAEAMRDSQKMINSSARLIIDNKALSGNGMVAINLDRINTKRTKNLKVYPGKTWYTKGNFDPKEAIDSVNFTDVTQGLQDLMMMFERFADEETGIPKYSQGEQSSFLNKTAAGMSMLMTQANINLKTVMKNIDDFWIEPIVEAMHSWFMTFGEDNSIKMPIKIKAIGTDSLLAKEMKLESLAKFMQVTANPQDAIFVDRVKAMKVYAKSLDTEDIMRPDDEIKKIMDEMSARSQQEPKVDVDLDKLFPYLSRNEQVQILQSLGIQPDPNFIPPVKELPAPGGSA